MDELDRFESLYNPSMSDTNRPIGLLSLILRIRSVIAAYVALFYLYSVFHSQRSFKGKP